MIESILAELSEDIRHKPFLTREEICKILDCTDRVICNWIKRTNPKRRPPRIIVGKKTLFPKKEFFAWLVSEQKGATGE
jgi:hypothetical protein